MGQTGPANEFLTSSSAFSVLQRLRRHRPTTKKELSDYLKVFLKLSVPGRPVCNGTDKFRAAGLNRTI